MYVDWNIKKINEKVMLDFNYDLDSEADSALSCLAASVLTPEGRADYFQNMLDGSLRISNNYFNARKALRIRSYKRGQLARKGIWIASFCYYDTDKKAQLINNVCFFTSGEEIPEEVSSRFECFMVCHERELVERFLSPDTDVHGLMLDYLPLDCLTAHGG